MNITWEDQDAFADRYSCKCNELRGRVFEGEVCPICKTKVKFNDVDLGIFGWIVLDNHCIIQPIYYNMLKSAIGKEFIEIVESNIQLTRDGFIMPNVETSNPYFGIGIMEFKRKYREILEYYWKKNKDKRNLLQDLINEKDKVFASCIPVYSSVLRPVFFRNETYSFVGADKKYNVIYAHSIRLNNLKVDKKKKRSSRYDTLDEPGLLTFMQRALMELWSFVFNEIDGKNGHIRGQLLGGRINFSARNVIIPDPTLRADQVRLGYRTFIELFKYELIALLAKVNGTSYNQCYEEWYKATIKFDQKIYEMMMHYIKKKKPKIIINRKLNCGLYQ